jgi:hypothetical protein
MVLANIDRRVVFPTREKTDNYTITITDPRWSHLNACYQILKGYFRRFPFSDLIDCSLVRRLLFLAQVPDARERAEIGAFLCLYFDRRSLERIQLLKEIKYRLILLRDVPLMPYCGTTLLLVARHILTHSSRECSSHIAGLFFGAVLPLVTGRDLGVFYSQLRALVIDFVTEYPTIGVEVLKDIQNRWAITSAYKEPLMLNLVVNVAMVLSESDFSRIAGHFFKFLSELMNSPNSLVVDQAISVFRNADTLKFLAKHPSFVKTFLEDSVRKLVNHWSYDIGAGARACLGEVGKLVEMANGANVELIPDRDVRMPVQQWGSIIEMVRGSDTPEALASMKRAYVAPGRPTRILPFRTAGGA